VPPLPRQKILSTARRRVSLDSVAAASSASALDLGGTVASDRKRRRAAPKALASAMFALLLAACGGGNSDKAVELAEACWRQEAAAAFMYKEIRGLTTEITERELTPADEANGLQWKADVEFTFAALVTGLDGQDSWQDSFGSLAVIVKDGTMIAGDSYHGIVCDEGIL
jgi:hypothetical protein